MHAHNKQCPLDLQNKMSLQLNFSVGILMHKCQFPKYWTSMFMKDQISKKCILTLGVTRPSVSTPSGSVTANVTVLTAVTSLRKNAASPTVQKRRNLLAR